MELFKTLASKFQAINRMGQNPSSQANAEQPQPEEVNVGKPWDPDHALGSSDDDRSGKSTTLSSPKNSEPDLPLGSTVRMASPGNRKRKRQSRVKAHAADEDGTTMNHESHDLHHAVLGHKYATAHRVQETNKMSLSDEDSGREEKIIHPQTERGSSQNDGEANGLSEREGRVDKSSNITDGLRPLQVRPKTAQDRHQCPQSQNHNCDKTFSSQRSAARHALSHTVTFPCVVCEKAYSRADTLQQHQSKHHSKAEVDAASTSRLFSSSPPDHEIEDLVEDTGSTASDIGSPGLKQAIHKSGKGLQQSLNNNSLMTDSPSAAEKIVVKPVPATVSFPSDDVVVDDVLEEMVKETPRPKFRLKRIRNARDDNGTPETPSASAPKRRRLHSLSPTSSMSAEDDFSNETGLKQNIANPTVVPQPQSTKPRLVKLGNLDNFAKPWTPGSQLHHPIHNPKSPRVRLVNVLIPRSTHAESSTRPATKKADTLLPRQSSNLDSELLPTVTTKQYVPYTSSHGKGKAVNGVVYSSPPKSVNYIDDSDILEPQGMATSVARKDNPGMSSLKRSRKESEESEENGVDGRKGAFLSTEVRKLERWRDRFCDENDINIQTFNQMMTDSCRRQQKTQWPYRFIKKADFLQEYYEILPDRNRRSMHRYRERAFQNVPEKQDWTRDDDFELIQLVKELGPKWVEIGQRMTRTQDSVNQRWRFRLQYEGEVHHGEWLQLEEEKLKEAVAKVKRESGLPLDPTAEVKIPWDSVSKKMKGKRTAQQCSNKWRSMYQKRSGNKFYKQSDLGVRSRTSSVTSTPSRMTQRLAGQSSSAKRTGSSSKKKFMSDERVHESDNSDSAYEEKSVEDMPKEAISPSNGSAKTPIRRREITSENTPQTIDSLSQAFMQTQANTSAMRAPNTSRKPHTQAEMPTPGIPIQHRPPPSQWLAVNGNKSPSKPMRKEDAEDVMPQPESSDKDAKPIADQEGGGSVEQISGSISAASNGEDSETEASETSDESSSNSSNASVSNGFKAVNSDMSDVNNDGDGDSDDDDDDDDDEMRGGVRRGSFANSSQASSDAHTLYSSKNSQRRTHSGIDWGNVGEGDVSVADAGSEDEGDIDHH